jgi:hypothetical protein
VTPVVYLAFCLLFGNPILLLDLSYELVPLPFDLIKLIVGQPAPLFFDFALKLVPELERFAAACLVMFPCAFGGDWPYLPLRTSAAARHRGA